MYIQWFVKGISGDKGALDWPGAQSLLTGNIGIRSNWLRNKAGQSATTPEIATALTEHDLDRHLHDYPNFGAHTPFISVAAGAVERNALAQKNEIYSALTTALEFATGSWAHPGTLYFGWIVAALNPAVSLSVVAEEVRSLNTYHRWSPFQLEGELTAKVAIPANQIERAEWWDGAVDRQQPADVFPNPGFVPPAAITNVRELF